MLSLRGFECVWFIKFRGVQVVMLVMSAKTTDVSLHKCASTYFPKGLQSSESFRTSCTPDCFEIMDSAVTKYH